MSDLRIGVLGVGHIGAVHLQSALAMDGATVVAAADAEASNRSLARRLGAPTVYSEFADLLESESIDAAIVALPPFLHEEATVRATQAGCHVFVEKPFARSSDEARRMIDAASEAEVAIGVDHPLRYQQDMRSMKEAYDSGRLGRVPLCHLSRINNGPFERPPAEEPVPGWPLEPEAAGGGAVMDLGIHLFDFLRWVFGPISVQFAEVDSRLGLDYEDTAAIVVRAERTDTLATVHCGFYQWEEPPDINMRARFDGVVESIESSDFRPDFYRHAGTSAVKNLARTLLGSDPEHFEPTYYYRAHFEALQSFVDAVREGRDPPVNGDDGLRTIELVEAVYRAAGDTAAEPDPAKSPVGGD